MPAVVLCKRLDVVAPNIGVPAGWHRDQEMP